MSTEKVICGQLPARSRAFYRKVLDRLTKAKIPFLVGGAFALEYYTGVWRYTKDLDIFIRPQDIGPTLKGLEGNGFQVELTYPHWLGKILDGTDFVDVIFSSGNGVARVDDDWFVHAQMGNVLGTSLRICPVEEMIWSKAFVMERERFDGADVAHLILAQNQHLNWQRLRNRFGPHGEVLLSHLVLFGFIYPTQRKRIPDWLIQELFRQLLDTRENPPGSDPAFRGSLLSREQYLIDMERWGYPDVRLRPQGTMSPDEIAVWTEAIGRQE